MVVAAIIVLTLRVAISASVLLGIKWKRTLQHVQVRQFPELTILFCYILLTLFGEGEGEGEGASKIH